MSHLTEHHQIITMRAQAAFEYIVIVSVILAFTIPLWIFYFNVQGDASTEITLAHTKSAARRIAETANLISSQGPPAKATISLFIPDGIQSVNISDNIISFKVQVDGSLTDVFEISEATLNGTIPIERGNYLITIEAQQGFVDIRW